jgi:hypothetical protein
MAIVGVVKQNVKLGCLTVTPVCQEAHCYSGHCSTVLILQSYFTVRDFACSQRDVSSRQGYEESLFLEYPEDGSNNCLRMFGTYIPVCTTLHPRRPERFGCFQ